MSILNAVRRLDRLDWNFPGSGNTAGSAHTLHWFPGNFIPQIPSALIQVLSTPGSLVFDPFGGSGTTGVEAAYLGRRGLVSDALSVCTLIMRAKQALLSGVFDRNRRSTLLNTLDFESQCRSDQVGTFSEGSSSDLEAWFTSDTLSQLRFLWQLVEQEPDSAARDVLTAIFSNVLFDCAAPGSKLTSTGKRRRHHWGWVADNVRPRQLIEHNAIAFFRQRVINLDEPRKMPRGGGVTVIQQDARQLALPNNSVDIIITSPPYIGVIDYTHANRLLYSWMNWSILEERRQEIGARFRRQRVHAVSEYLSDMRLARDELHRVLKPGGFCAIVIGESKKFTGVAERLLADFSNVMEMIWGPTPRYPTRRRVSDSAAREPVEFVCVFHKEPS